MRGSAVLVGLYQSKSRIMMEKSWDDGAQDGKYYHVCCTR